MVGGGRAGWGHRLAAWLAAAWLVMAAGPALAQERPCLQCHASAGAMYLGQLASPGASAAGCPVLAGLRGGMREIEDRLVALERELGRAAARGWPVGPQAAALGRAQGRLVWAQGRELVSAGQARANLAQVDGLLRSEVERPLLAHAQRERRGASLGLGLVAGLGLLLAWLVGRRRALSPPDHWPLEAVRQGRLE